MDLKEIRKIVELMNEHGLTHFDMSKDGFHLKLKKGQDLDSLRDLMALMPTASAAPAPMASAVPHAANPGGGAHAPEANGEAITSPMVGTFYTKPSPDAAPFVSVGDAVSEGQVLCIIEAMKVMNEIKAERTGTITEVVAEDGEQVQLGDDMFRVK